jgi:hypothetical protein
MEIVVQLRSDVAQLMNRPDATLRAAATQSGDAARLADALAPFNAALTPQHPGASDPQLARWFVVHCDSRDAQACERIAAALREAGVDAYVKPEAEPS